MARQRRVERRVRQPKSLAGGTEDAEQRAANAAAGGDAESSVKRDESFATDLLPARMINEVVYCPRLFYYEHVEGVFVHNRETIEGGIQHHRVDAKEDDLPPPAELLETDRPARWRSVSLSSDRYGVIAKLDLIESDGAAVVPVDYKRGAPRTASDGTLFAWDTDRVQLGVQALVLRDNGYSCTEAIVFYAKTRQRVRLVVDELIDETLAAIDLARRVRSGPIPPPLADSSKCPRCSLVGVCLPDETNACDRFGVRSQRPIQRTLFDLGELPVEVDVEVARPTSEDVRRLVPARDDLRPLYLNTPGLYVGKSGRVLKVKDKQRVVQEVRLNEICQVNLLGNVQMSTQAIQELCRAEIPIAYFSGSGWFFGLTTGLGVKNIYLRRDQFRLAERPSFCLQLARALVAGKIKNQRTLLQRNHVEPPKVVLSQMKWLQQDAERAASQQQLLGIEGNAARLYFENLAGMIKVGDSTDQPRPAGASDAALDSRFSFDFFRRNRRPPRDPVNALLSLSYSLLAKDMTIVSHAVGFDPYLGFYHQPRFGRAALALDLMEPFRPLIADSAVLSAINTRMVTASDFIRAGHAVALTTKGRQKFLRAYEQRMDALVTHPLFSYRVNYRRMLEIQTRLLARFVTGELNRYPVFTTR